eukprot:gene27016-2242_t
MAVYERTSASVLTPQFEATPMAAGGGGPGGVGANVSDLRFGRNPYSLPSRNFGRAAAFAARDFTGQDLPVQGVDGDALELILHFTELPHRHNHSIFLTLLTLIMHGWDFTGQDLPVQGVDGDALELILHFFYSGDCPIGMATALPLLDAAAKLEVPGLSAACEQYISQMLHPLTAAIFLEQALLLKVDSMSDTLLVWIRQRFEEVVNSEAFLACNVQTMLKMVSDNRHRQQELLVFKAASKWLLADNKRLESADDVFR